MFSRDGEPSRPREKPARFLRAHWRFLVMLNFEVPPAALEPLVPRGTELDSWGGKTFASVVGFLFEGTRVLGLAIPFHVSFEEVNLRFYVKRRHPEGDRRGVVFIREIVPRWAIATVARVLYNENYVSLPMRHTVDREGDTLRPAARVGYAWRSEGAWHDVGASIEGEPVLAAKGSEEEFITEHYWGYAKQRNGGTVEYEVEHPPWRLWRARATSLGFAGFYGGPFEAPLSGAPTSCFVAEGSAVTVRRGVRIR